MTMFEFMANAFYMLCGVVCIALAVLIVFSVVNGIIKERGKGKRNGRNQCFCAPDWGSGTPSRRSFGGFCKAWRITKSRAQRGKFKRKTTRSQKCGKRNTDRKPKFPIAGNAGAINARGWRNAHNPAKAQSRTGYARSPVSVAGTVCASSLAKKRNAKTSCRA